MVLLNYAVSSNAFHINSFPPKVYLYISVYKLHTTHNPIIRSEEGPTFDTSALGTREPIYIINLVDKAKLSFATHSSPKRRSTTVSLELSLFIHTKKHLL